MMMSHIHAAAGRQECHGTPATTSEFLSMDSHGETVRRANGRGTLILSKLPAGTSRIFAGSPSVRFVLAGEEQYTIEGRNRTIRSGEFLLVEGGVDSVVRTSRDCIGLCVYLPSLATARQREPLGHPAITGSVLDPFSAELREQAVALVAEALPAVQTEQFIAKAAERAERFAARMHRTGERLSQVRPAARLEILQRLERVRAYVHSHVDSTLSLDMLAREAALSRFHLIRTFAEAYGASPVAYHRALRLDLAAEKLRRGEASPSQLSHELGYATLSAFTRAFRNRFGAPPSSFAKERG